MITSIIYNPDDGYKYWIIAAANSNRIQQRTAENEYFSTLKSL